ncbi:ABC transporter ATP-binding protein [Breznakia pachnodae]|uniref:ABC-2 type transport system ATP-binding protein n=1 Tax=Breznakia pachnodae TaxID=265178 RepID=A0ABU0E871_9FIRM|nr:ABC transporter ATP-binding protein [Breznakia pachnodae]MDQ0362914.1 ABC-2 type transport system ATP-binding protein [Breznakia pachnodae]
MKILEVKGLMKNYGKSEILKDVNFEVNTHEVIGFIGPNGAGKTTTMKCISGLTGFHQGSIQVDGHDIKKDRIEALKYQTSMIEGPALYPELSGKENIKLFASLRGVSKERVDEMIEMTKLGKNINRKVSQYSMGMKQRVGLAISLMSNPKLIMLDEPTNGLDPSGVIDLLTLVKELATKEEIGILFSSHTLADVEKIADRIIFIKDGQLIDESQFVKDQSIVYEVKTEEDINDILKDQFVFEYNEVVKTYTIRLEKKEDLNELLQLFSKNQVTVLDISKVEQSIEDVYKDIYYD